MSTAHMARMLTKQLKQINRETLWWAFPALVTAGWILWPTIEYEWKMEMGLAPDPEAVINRVQAEKDQRLAAKASNAKPPAASKDKDEDDEEEEQEEEAEEETVAAEEEEESEEEGGGDVDDANADANADDEDVPAAEDGDDEESSDEEEEEEEESEEAPVPPLYLPTKSKKLALTEVWDNFTLKAVQLVRSALPCCCVFFILVIPFLLE